MKLIDKEKSKGLVVSKGQLPVKDLHLLFFTNLESKKIFIGHLKYLKQIFSIQIILFEVFSLLLIFNLNSTKIMIIRLYKIIKKHGKAFYAKVVFMIFKINKLQMKDFSASLIQNTFKIN